MSDSDSDDDLLALAGAGGEDDAGESTEDEGMSRAQTGSGKRSGSNDIEQENGGGGDDDDEDDDDEGRAEADDSDATDDEQTVLNPYPLEGKYKDEKDRDYLEGLPEIERESILFDRSQEMQKYEERQYLVQRAREQKKSQKSSADGKRRSARDKVSDPALSKRSKLSELKQRRQEKRSRVEGGEAPYRKKKRVKGEDDYSDEEEEEDESDRENASDEYESDDEGGVKWADTRSTGTEECSLDDINSIRLGKSFFSQYCHNPGFELSIIGCFVRVNIGMNQQLQQPVYRLCQIKGLTSVAPYTFMDRTNDEALVVSQGDSEKTFEMGICSDSNATQEEFDWWKSMLKGLGSKITKRQITRKKVELEEFKNHHVTADELEVIIQRRQKLTGNSLSTNVVLEKAILQERRAVALENGRFDEVQKIDSQLDSLERSLSKHKRRSELDKLSKVNERNRKANLEEIRKAELAAADARRKAALNNDFNAGNPFLRLRTAARMFYQSDREAAAVQPVAVSKEAALEQEEALKDEEKRQKRIKAKFAHDASALDDAIANVDFVLDIEI